MKVSGLDLLEYVHTLENPVKGYGCSSLRDVWQKGLKCVLAGAPWINLLFANFRRRQNNKIEKHIAENTAPFSDWFKNEHVSSKTSF